MKLKIIETNEVTWPVTVNLPQDGGKVTETTFFARFKRLSEEQFDELGQKGVTAIIKEALIGVGETDSDIESVTADDKENLTKRSNYRTGLYNAYLKMDSGIAEKN